MYQVFSTLGYLHHKTDMHNKTHSTHDWTNYKKLKDKLNANFVMPVMIMFLNYLTLNQTTRSFGF